MSIPVPGQVSDGKFTTIEVFGSSDSSVSLVGGMQIGGDLVVTGSFSSGSVTAASLATTGADVDVSAAAPPVAGQILKATSATTATWQADGGSGVTSGSNVGAAGVGPFKQISGGTTMEFRNVNAASSKITVALDGANDEIDIDVSEGSLTLDNLGGTLSVSKGGTGATTFTSGNILRGAGGSAITATLAAPTGAIVGTTDTQILSNKTLTLPQLNDTSADHQYIFAVSELTADRTVTWPLLVADDTLVFQSHIQTLSNKTLTDNLVSFADNGDSSKLAQFDCADITTATTRTFTFPDANIRLGDTTVTYHFDANAVDSTIFVADDAWEVVTVSEAHSVAGSDGGSVTLQVNKCTGTQAPSAGVNTLTSTIDLKGAANTVSSGTLNASASNYQLASGDRICAVFSGTLTDLAGACVTLRMKRI